MVLAHQPATRERPPAVYRGEVRARDLLPTMRPAVVVSLLVFALAGLMFTAAALASKGTDLRAERAVELRDLVRERSDRLADSEQTVADLQQNVDDLTSGRVGDPAIVATRARITALESAAGMSPVRGRSVTVTLDDAPARAADDPLWQTVSPDDVIVHQGDIQAVVNALWRGGARGIQVMDQRLIATSAIRCVGNTLLLQGRAYSPPYVITAVGPAKRMQASLRKDAAVASYRAWARVVGLGYSAERTGRQTIDGYTGAVTLQYATPEPTGQ